MGAGRFTSVLSDVFISELLAELGGTVVAGSTLHLPGIEREYAISDQERGFGVGTG